VTAVSRLGLVLCGCLGLAGCRRPVAFSMPGTVAAGRPATCGPGPVDPYGSGMMTSDARRCTYEDAIGDGPTRLGGHVRFESEGGLPGAGAPLTEIEVTVRPVEGPGQAPGTGRRVAHARTDAQGAFHLSAVLRAGLYDVVAQGADGVPLASVRIELEGDRARRVEDLVISVPLAGR
jgi:hypothetical protein